MHSVLIFGCGKIAGGFDADRPENAWPLTHAGAFRRHGGFRLAGCIDPDPDARAAFQNRWGVAQAAASIEGLEDLRPDIVSICSPNAHHEEHLRSALALRPRLIFCEKPITPSAAATARWVRECADAGTLLAVNYTRRWDPAVTAFADELANGIWGSVRSVTGTYTKGIIHNGGHMVDLLHLLFGPVELVAAGAPVYDFWDDDPSVPALLQSRDGVQILLAAADARDYALFELVVVLERGEVAIRDGGLSWTVRHAGASGRFAGYQTLQQFEARAGRYDEAMTRAVTNIAAALDSSVPLASDGASALSAQRLCEKIRDAALTRASIQSGKS